MNIKPSHYLATQPLPVQPLPALVDLLNDGDLVHVEEYPGGVAHEEGRHDCHEDEGEVVLLLPPAGPPPLADHQVDLVVEEADGQEGDDAQHQKSDVQNEESPHSGLRRLTLSSCGT